MLPLFLFFFLVGSLSCCLVNAITSPQWTLMDNSGGLRLNKITSSGISTTDGVVCVITSPGTKSFLLTSSTDDDSVLSLSSSLIPSDVPRLVCRGATLRGTSNAERIALSVTSLVSDAIVIDGITEGDATGFGKNTRHARTMTALFRARLAFLGSSSSSKDESSTAHGRQALIFCVKSSSKDSFKVALDREVRPLFDATAAETNEIKISFDDLYTVRVVSVTNDEEGKETLAMADGLASDFSSSISSESILASAIQKASERVKESGIATVALDSPHIAHAFLTVSNSHVKQSRSARAKIATWKSRVYRGLWAENFGADAGALRNRILSGFDSETLVAAGLPLVASYRLEMRTQLESLVDASIAELFEMQVINLEKRTLKRLKSHLLKKLDVTPVEEVSSENAAAIRAAMFSFDNVIGELEVPSLSLTKTKPCRDMESKLTDEVINFPDSPAAKVKRTKKITEVTSKEKKPGQRSVDIGLDLVAMLRPDGFGSLQGFANYQLGGNSITFGIHNDADDPATISQFGGVRPPLLRIQPKLRVDFEM